MTDLAHFAELSPCAYAAALDSTQFMDCGLTGLWPEITRIAGPAYTVSLTPGDHLMLHAAIYQAPAGAIIVVNGGDNHFAVAGGNVCAIAQQRGIAGFIVDGVVRDKAEIREMRFPVFARGVVPNPGKKGRVAPLNVPVQCGGVTVHAGDIIVADEEGIAVLPRDRAAAAYQQAKVADEKEAAMTLEQWEAQHRAKVFALLGRENGSE